MLRDAVQTGTVRADCEDWAEAYRYYSPQPVTIELSRTGVGRIHARPKTDLGIIDWSGISQFAGQLKRKGAGLLRKAGKGAKYVRAAWNELARADQALARLLSGNTQLALLLAQGVLTGDEPEIGRRRYAQQLRAAPRPRTAATRRSVRRKLATAPRPRATIPTVVSTDPGFIELSIPMSPRRSESAPRPRPESSRRVVAPGETTQRASTYYPQPVEQYPAYEETDYYPPADYFSWPDEYGAATQEPVEMDYYDFDMQPEPDSWILDEDLEPTIDDNGEELWTFWGGN